MTIDKKSLRKQLRAHRRALTPAQQRHAALGLTARFRQHHIFRHARRIALYVANDGEIDPIGIIHWCWKHGKDVYLPVLRPHRHGELVFLPYTPYTPLSRNRFGIPEPAHLSGSLAPLWTLDIIFTPLVGFDTQGNRMGMGGGFYDRTLASLQARALAHQPRIWGVAHECQRVEQIPCDPWDIGLEGVVTDKAVYETRCPGQKQR